MLCLTLVYILFNPVSRDDSSTIVIVSLHSVNGQQLSQVVETDWSRLNVTVTNLSRHWENYDSKFAPITKILDKKSRKEVRRDLCYDKGKSFFPTGQWTATTCSRAAVGNSTALQQLVNSSKTENISDEQYITNMSNCTILNEYLQSFEPYTSLEEKEFPLAFVMIFAYRSQLLQQYMRQLRLLYRRHNVYCIHIDRKGPDWWIDGIQSMIKCLPNVVFIDDPVKVWFRHWSLLEAQLRCYSVLLDLEEPVWKYGITVKGVEMPLVTNREMVKFLKTQNNRVVLPKVASPKDPFALQVILDQTLAKTKLLTGIARLSNILLPPVPNEVQLYRSFEESVSSALPRDFIEFCLADDRSLDLRKYLKEVQAAEDFFYQTVNRLLNPAPPGQVLARSVTPPIIYMYHDKNDSCVIGNYLNLDKCTVQRNQLYKIMKLAEKKQHFFYHKYLLSHDAVVISCLEEKLKLKNKYEFSTDCGKFHYNE